MRKYIALLLTLTLLLTLAACGGREDTPSGITQTTNPISGDNPGSDQSGGETQPQEIQDTPFGEYLSEEEILAMLDSGDFSEYLSVDPEAPADPVDTGGDEPYSGFSNSIIFTSGGDAEGVEFTDFLDELPPDVQAEFEEMQEAMTDPEMMEMFEGMEEGG